jgi:hypothetical protein
LTVLPNGQNNKLLKTKRMCPQLPKLPRKWNLLRVTTNFEPDIMTGFVPSFHLGDPFPPLGSFIQFRSHFHQVAQSLFTPLNGERLKKNKKRSKSLPESNQKALLYDLSLQNGK